MANDMTEQRREGYVRGLLEEHANEKKKGRLDRVAQIEDELTKVGGLPPFKRSAKRT